MGNVISIGTVEVVAILGILAAYWLGKINGSRKNWPKKEGGILDGPEMAPTAWRMPLMIVMLLAIFMILFSRMINSLFDKFGGGRSRGYEGGGGEYRNDF